MKRRSIALAVIALMVALISLCSLVACNGLFDGLFGDGNQFRFDDDATPMDVLDMVDSGEINNYTLKVKQGIYENHYYYSPDICLVEEYRIYNGTTLLYKAIYFILEDEAFYEISGSVEKYSSLAWKYRVLSAFETYLGDERAEAVDVQGATISWIAYVGSGVYATPCSCELYDANNTKIVLPDKYKNYKEVAHEN